MKSLLVSSIFYLTLPLAAKEVAPEDTAGEYFPKITRVQRHIKLQDLENTRQSLIMIDGGGSTDIGSIMCPASVYMTFWKDGEEHNVTGVYKIIDCYKSLESYSLNKNVLSLVYSNLDDTLKLQKHSLEVDFSNIAKELKLEKTANDFEDIQLKAKLKVTEK